MSIGRDTSYIAATNEKNKNMPNGLALNIVYCIAGSSMEQAALADVT